MTGTTLSPYDRDRNAEVDVDRHRLSRISRYDLLLGVVPVAFLVGLLASGLADVPFHVAMSSAAAVGALALVDGLFLNPPRGPPIHDEGGSA